MTKEQACKNYSDKFSQLQNIKGRETGINIDTRFMQFKIQRAKTAFLDNIANISNPTETLRQTTYTHS